MKKIIYLLLAFSFLTGCNEDDDKKNDSEKITEIKNTVTTGKWKITLFSEDGIDETADYNGYQFTFTEGTSSISAAEGANTYPGSWSITDDNSNDDSNHYEDLDFNISFSAPADLTELTEDWEIISMTDTRIELRHISGGGGGTDLLTLERV